ncbi:SDR family NAD(P)-dependent oxidoreductase [Burkholderia sp. USMB20]|uniref:SDR family NAD(P)-dependent oxidoreductase n=1 Tax=Burkholderia sp. USMB20 TaxID=1571773 RepID=UPI0005CE3915|nr:SDR family oxidoreductase [Burkholderia sp. USMB20]TGN95689.1 SDR family oxidoreductase [Burkholderia sp. USMB20]
MIINLSGKIALVTGSTAGIGFGVVQGLAAAGATVVLNGRIQDEVDAAVTKLRGAVRGVVAELGTIEGHQTLVDAVPAADIVVSNLGIIEQSDFFVTDDETWARHWNVNVMAGVRLARSYLPGMKEKGWGRFIFLGSESAFNIPVEMIHYGVSKTADVALARGLAKRMAGTGVTVNSVLPGPTLSESVTSMLERQRGNSERSIEDLAKDFVKKHRSSSIIQRATTINEVANMIVYLASPQATATTGAAVRVDGGVIDTIM